MLCKNARTMLFRSSAEPDASTLRALPRLSIIVATTSARGSISVRRLIYPAPHGGNMGKTGRVALYVRVSTDGQTTINQQRELEAVAERHGWTIVEVFKDHAVSGKNGREKRPAFDQLL